MQFFDRLFFLTFGGHFEKVKTSFESLPPSTRFKLFLLAFFVILIITMENPDVDINKITDLSYIRTRL